MSSAKPKPAKVVVHVFRHGERPTTSLMGGDLTKKGEQQAVSIGKKLAKELGKTKRKKLVKFYSSPISRNTRFMELISDSLRKETGKQKLPVKELSPRVREKFKYGKIFDRPKFEELYGKMPFEEFNRLWIRGKTNPKVVEQPAEVLARIRKNAEEFAARISERYSGRTIEVHIVIVSHGDLMGALRQQITGRQAMLGKQAVGFGERIKLVLKGRKGIYESRGFKRKFVAKRPKRLKRPK